MEEKEINQSVFNSNPLNNLVATHAGHRRHITKIESINDILIFTLLSRY